MSTPEEETPASSPDTTGTTDAQSAETKAGSSSSAGGASVSSADERAADSAAPTTSKRRRKRKKRKKKTSAAHDSDQHGGHGAGGAHSHSHGHSHSHSHGGDSHGHGHGHSHGGGGDKFSSPMMKEAVHYIEVLRSFEEYATNCLQRFHSNYHKWMTIDYKLRSLLPHMDAKFGAIKRAIAINQEFVRKILAGRSAFMNGHVNYDVVNQHVGQAKEHNVSKAQSTLRQCARDWSSDGAAERDECYGRVLRELERLYPDPASRVGVRVLVPGSGLGRLVWECCRLGFSSQGNEFSYHMLLASFIILNKSKKLEHKIHPFVHQTTNVMRVADQLRSVQFPDVDPTDLPPTAQFSMMAGDFLEVYGAGRDRAMAMSQPKQVSKRPTYTTSSSSSSSSSSADPSAPSSGIASTLTTVRITPPIEITPMGPLPASADSKDSKDMAPTSSSAASTPASSAVSVIDPCPEPCPDGPALSWLLGNPEDYVTAGEWDVVATCYFLDTAHNILEYIRCISQLLKPGGYWVNFGPLLYHFADMGDDMSIELTYEEIRAVLPEMGLRLVHEQTGIPSHYTQNRFSMLNMSYRCVLFTCVKTWGTTSDSA